ncbi:hypothetical protein ACLB2K_037651 [Fragaria x ananassa]
MVKTVSLYGFPTVESSEAVTKFLEEYTGEGTVLSVNVLPPKADDQSLWYGESYLKAREWKRSTVLEELVTLHFGCKISEEKFSVLWTKSDVSVTFGMELKNVQLTFSNDGVEYKLELPTDTICRIDLHCPCDQFRKFLLIQVCQSSYCLKVSGLRGAPRIYKKDATLASADNWIREIDFTPSCCIGQSSSLCLELPLSCAVPDLGKSYIHYIENEGRFVLKRGNTFSSNSALVPILAPPLRIALPYKILFKINSLVQHGCIPGQALDVNFYNLVDPASIRIEYIESALDKLFNSKECCYEPVRWLHKQCTMYKACKRIPQSPAISLDEGFVYVHRVLITPTKVYFCGPEVNLSNRVLRNYPEDTDNLLRVSFVDEDLGKMSSVDLCPRTHCEEEERRTRVYERILSVLRDGIVIGEKKFELLAFSGSQLRENSAWMFASRRGLTAQGIRDWMGDFSHIKNVSKYGARLGQSFSSSRETFSVGSDEIEVIPDVEIERDGTKYCFSDGIGKISADFAERVARKCGKSSTPSAFQIRYGGYKGVVEVDPTLSKKLALRKSMCKFKSLNTKDHVFKKKQKQAIKKLEGILTDPLKAQEALGLMFQGEATNILKEMLMCYKPNAEPFLSLMLRSLCASKLAELRTKTRIFVQKGRSLMGCLDETGTLEYGQVFVQCSHHAIFTGNNTTSTASQGNFTVEGKVVVAKNPCVHPGDVRVLMAVDVPALHHMVDCIVFPQKGKSWDHELIPPLQFNPMSYTPAPTVELDHDVTIEEVAVSFTNYIVNDSLGIISNAHLVTSDIEPQKARSDKSVELAKLLSHAVDSPKTCVIVKLPPNLRVKTYPDFMEKTDESNYKSKRVIGKLYRQVKNIELGSHSHSFNSFTRDVARRFYDPDMEVDGFEDYIEDAIRYKSEYEYKLGKLMDYYGILTEAEILSGNITNVSKFFKKRKDLESINYAVKSLKKEARTWFMEKPTSDDPSDIRTDISLYAAKASAWYHVTYHHRYWGCYNNGMARDHFLSFPWCVFDILIQIKRHHKSKRSSHHSDSRTHLWILALCIFILGIAFLGNCLRDLALSRK